LTRLGCSLRLTFHQSDPSLPSPRPWRRTGRRLAGTLGLCAALLTGSNSLASPEPAAPGTDPLLHLLRERGLLPPPAPGSGHELVRQVRDVASDLVMAAMNLHLGVPYKEAGMDPSGFDCSGFTCYVFAANGVSLPRRAADQYTHCQKIEPEEALAGDLVFFTNGTQINHVGILISDKGAPKQMIHSSSSIGISIVVIDDSAYWSARVAGYGRIKSAK